MIIAGSGENVQILLEENAVAKRLLVCVISIFALFHAGRAAVRQEVIRDWEMQKGFLEHHLADRYPGGRCDWENDQDWRPQAVEEVLDTNANVFPADGDPLGVVLRRVGALLNHLSTMPDYTGAETFQSEFNQLRTSAEQAGADRDALYLEACRLRRRVVFSNPLLDFDTLLFNAYGTSGTGSSGHHMQMEYRAFNAKEGGGIYKIMDFKHESPSVRNILDGVKVESGRLAGSELVPGSFLSPELSFDGTKIYFSYAEPGGKKTIPKRDPRFFRERPDKRPGPENYFHIFKMNVDGSNLVQLTDASADDVHPCPLPNGRIAFTSTRRQSGVRCHGGPMDVDLLFSMKDDGSDIYSLSYFETHEFHPSVDNDGKIVYSRWDYVDRNDEITCNLWVCNPDGRDPRAPHGNYPLPYSTVDTSQLIMPIGEPVPGCIDGRDLHPYSEFNIRAVPGEDRVYVATVGPHHGNSFGNLILIDTKIPDDDKMSQARRITIENGFLENIVKECPLNLAWGTAWPLSRDYYLCTWYDGIYVLDRFGNREMICSINELPGLEDFTSARVSVNAFRLIDPMPLRAREKPPIIPTRTNKGEDRVEGQPTAKISVQDCRISDLPFPEGVELKWLRIVQVFPDWWGYGLSDPLNGGEQQAARMPLGIVPIEDDGSVYFEAPVERMLYFQVLDENGTAVQSMRSATYVHPGEHLSCTGCHEDKWNATPPGGGKALQGEPSLIQTEVSDGAVPFNFYRLVKPVFDNRCLPCHTEKNKGPDMSYTSLLPYAFYYAGDDKNHCRNMVGGSRTVPGLFGARVSSIYRLLKSTHKDRVTLNEDEMRRVTLWLDCLSPQFGVYPEDKVAVQRAGGIAWPDSLSDVDSTNPMGYEIYPVPHVEAQKATGRTAPALRRPGTALALINTLPAVPHNASSLTVCDLRGRVIMRAESRTQLRNRLNELIRMDSQLSVGAYVISYE